jgi:hypothetical protein
MSKTDFANRKFVSFIPLITVKASNFGTHGNFGPLFQNGLLSSKRALQKKRSYKKNLRSTNLVLFIFGT